MYTVIKNVTPEIANDLLKLNTNNYRKYDNNRVASYSNDMINGKWQTNADPIRISKSGVLLDGQHRLMAIVKSGTTQEMLIVYDVDDSVSVFDVGMKRTRKQIAIQMGIYEPACNKQCISISSKIMNSAFGSTHKYGISDVAVLDYTKKNEYMLVKALSIVTSGKSSTNITRRATFGAAALYLLKSGEDEFRIKRFFEIVTSGFPNEYEECSPAIVLRNWIIYRLNKYDEETCKLLYSHIMCAYRDFKNGTPRKKMYILDDRVIKDYYKFCDSEIKSVMVEQ